MNPSRETGSESVVFGRLPQSSLAQEAMKSIRQAIIYGELKPKEALRESEIAAQFGISRAPVREALLMLEEAGLVKRIPNRGTFVTSFSREDVKELYSLRVVLERFAVELFVKRMKDDDLGELREIVNMMQDAATAEDAQKVNNYDLEFHEYIMRKSGHRYLLNVWQSLRFQISRALVAGNFLNEELHQIVKNHEPMLSAFEQRDVEKAQKHIEAHVSDSGRRVISGFA